MYMYKNDGYVRRYSERHYTGNDQGILKSKLAGIAIAVWEQFIRMERLFVK